MECALPHKTDHLKIVIERFPALKWELLLGFEPNPPTSLQDVLIFLLAYLLHLDLPVSRTCIIYDVLMFEIRPVCL